jgi:pentatricopeptide repeat protein
MTTNLERVYYFRYAQSLRFIGENEKGDEMMAIFDEMLENGLDKKK